MKKLIKFSHLFSLYTTLFLLDLALNFLYFKIFFQKSRNIRLPNYVKNEARIYNKLKLF
jgi:hypothetical protein